MNNSPWKSTKKAFKFSQKALSIDETDAQSHHLINGVKLSMKKYEKAIASGKRAVELYPNEAYYQLLLGGTLKDAGRIYEGTACVKQAMRLSPFPPYYDYHRLSVCYLQRGQYEDVLKELKKALQWAHRLLLSTGA